VSHEDTFTSTPDDAARYEAMRVVPDYGDERPTRLEADRDEADCPHLHQTDTADFDAFPPEPEAWVCDDCGQVL
jgi:hypothetical protein